MILFKIFQILTFVILAIALVISSLCLRSGLSFLDTGLSHSNLNDSSNNQIELTRVFSSINNELGRVYDQVVTNTTYTSLEKIDGLNRLTEDKLLEAVGISEGLELTSHDRNKLLNHLKSYPWIENYEVINLIFPKRIQIKVKEAEPGFLVDHQDRTWLMSKNGVLLEPLDDIKNKKIEIETLTLPRIYLDLPADVEKENTSLTSISEKLRTAIATLRYFELIDGLPFEFSTVRVLPYGEILLEVNQEAPMEEVIILAHNLSEAKVKKRQLELIIEDLLSRSSKVKQIDLRFKRQGIVR